MHLISYFPLAFNCMALNSVHCAEVPLRNCSLTRHASRCNVVILFEFVLCNVDDDDDNDEDDDFIDDSSVQFSYRVCVSRSLIIKIMTVVPMLSSYIEWFQFSAGRRTV